jgi:hypothetical protein
MDQSITTYHNAVATRRVGGDHGGGDCYGLASDRHRAAASLRPLPRAASFHRVGRLLGVSAAR